MRLICSVDSAISRGDMPLIVGGVQSIACATHCCDCCLKQPVSLSQNHKQSGSCCIPKITNHLKSKRMKDTVVSVLFRSSSGFEPQEVESVSTCLQSMERKPHAYLLSSSRNNTGNIHQKLLGHDYWLGLCQERIQSLENDRPLMPYVALLIAT